MIIYLDLVIILNYLFDFIILLGVNVTLKRGIDLTRILLSALIGEISLTLLLINNTYILIIGKLIIALMIVIVCFKYRDILYTINNLAYFYMISTILGGFVYFLKLNNINYLVIILISPLIIIYYIRLNNKIRNNYNNYYNLCIYFKNKRKIAITGFLDTGNKLVDPVSKKAIILLNKKLIKGLVNINKCFYVPYNSLNNKGLVKCINIDKIVIDNKDIYNVLVGIMDDNFSIDGIDCILNNKIWENIK